MFGSFKALIMAAFTTWVVSAGPVGLRLPRDTVSVTSTDLTNFEYYAQYAAAAYCNGGASAGNSITCSDDACPGVESANATIITSFAGATTDVEFYVAVDPTTELIVVAFRGTTSVRDWIVNFDFLFTAVNDIADKVKIHSGFYAQFVEAKSTLFSGVETAMANNPSYSILVTGHSLGAAVATIAAAYLRVQGYACDLWTYGSPRVGNNVFADLVTNQVGAEYRATHLDDPVPRLPPVWMGYRHTSSEYWWYTGTAETVDFTTSDAKICTGNANLNCNGGQFGLDTTAHSYYFEKITACSSSLAWKKKNKRDMTNTEIESMLNEWLDKDKAYIQSLTMQAGNKTTTGGAHST